MLKHAGLYNEYKRDMKALLIIVTSVLLVGVVLMGLVLFGPLSGIVSFPGKENLKEDLTDFFGIENRPGIGGNNGFNDPNGSGDGRGEIVGWSLPAQDGTPINVMPFYPTSSTTPTSTPGTTSTGSQSATPPSVDMDLVPPSAAPGEAYAISYIAQDQSFTITLLKEPIGETRRTAEEDFRKRLGISISQACSLRYVVLVPWWVSDYYSGKNLGFSFCPKATVL